MANPLSRETIVAGIVAHWDATFVPAVATALPGIILNTLPLDEWLELRITKIEQQPTRSTDNHAFDVEIVVEVFVKPHVINKVRIAELADSAADCLVQQSIEIPDYNTAGDPVIGYLQTKSAESEHDENPALSRVTIKISGRANSVSAPA